MNFSKYAAALALFATAAYAASENNAASEENKNTAANTVTTSKDDKKEVSRKTVDITSQKLVTAFNKCNTEENKNVDKMNECLKGEKVPGEVIAKLKGVKELKEDAAARIIEDVINELNEEKHWYDPINNIYGYVGGVVLLVAIGGGIYMAVGRKSEEADL